MSIQKLTVPLILALSLVVGNLSAPSGESLVVTSTTPPVPPPNDSFEAKENTKADSVPKIYQMHVQSKISNRFSRTTITSKVKNVAGKAQEATFAVVLPETAFISGFIMEIDGKNYTAYVKEKEEAKKDYDNAVASGLGAAHVAVNARDSNRFTVSVNIEPESKAAFYLSYEQLLQRQDGRYEQVINLHPGQPIQDFNVEVIITESRKIVDLRAPPLRSGNEIGNENSELDPRADLKLLNDTAAVVTFTPSLERQKQLAHVLGTKEDEGLAGQFIVQYDVERDPKGGEILIQDGYFVHFFAPSELAPLPKHVVFVLDTSGSMHGKRIEQLKEAMTKILEQLLENDLFSLAEFNSNVKVWNLDNPQESVWYPTENHNYNFRQTDEIGFENFTFAKAYPVNADTIKKAKATVSELQPDGGTDIYTGLKVGLRLVELGKAQKPDEIDRQPIIVFLTDGEPTVRVTNTDEIISKTNDLNSGARKSPIFALSFGRGADKKFLQKLASRNSGFSKHIYDAADASLQLQDFYKQISSPLLADVTFKYEPSVTSLTKTNFPIHFGGSELVVTGWCGTVSPRPVVQGWGLKGRIELQPTVEESISSVERLWAYLNVKQLLEKKETSDKDQEELKKKVLDLALKYELVTPVSSLVVVKPNSTKAVDTEEALEGNQGIHGLHKAFGGRGNIRSKTHSSNTSASGFQPLHHKVSHRPQSDLLEAAPQAFWIPPQPTHVPTLVTYITSTAPPPTTTTAISKLFVKLPWLKDVLDENGFYNSSSHGKLKLGQGEDISDLVECRNAPSNSTGHCALLHNCPQIHSLLTTSDVFVQHMCVLKMEYAGVCCPSTS